MPLYDIRCQKCGYEEERMIRLADVEKLSACNCPACSKKALTRVILNTTKGRIMGYCYDNDERDL